MLHAPFTGAGYLLRGLRLLGTPGIKRFVVIPLAVNVVLFALVLWLAADQFEAITLYLLPQLPDWLQWLEWVLWVLFGVTALLLVFFTFSIVANVVAAPFNGLLAEAVERHLTGKPAAEGSGVAAALLEAPKAIWDEIRKLGYFLRFAIPLLILFVVPGINLVAPFLWALFSAWMLAVEYGDYAMGNHGLTGAEQRRILAGRRFLSLGFGGLTLLATMVPVANFMVMPAAVAGAAAMWVEQLRPQARSAAGA